MAERPGLPSLRRDQALLRHQARRPLPLRQSRLPQGLHRHDRHRYGAQPHRAEQVADGLLPDGFVKEGRQRAPAPPLARHRLRAAWFMATVSARRCARRLAAPDGRRGQDRRGRRDLLRPGRRSPPAQASMADRRTKGGRSARPASVPSSRWSSVAATSARSTSRSPMARL